MLKKVGKVSVVVSCLLSLGCANHVKVSTITESQVIRDQKTHTVDIDSNTGSLVTVPQISVAVQDSKAFRVKSYEMKTDYDFSTPYQGLREFYEVPVGVALLPVGVVVNLADFLLLGLIPNSITDSILDTSFAGLNPFMNIESTSRVERTEIKSDKKLLDEKDEFVKLPLVNKEITVSSGDGASIPVMLDENGKAEISLVRLSAVSDDIEKIIITAKSEDVVSKKDIDVSRMLRSQLQQASAITKKYANLAKKEVKGDDVKQLDIPIFATDLIKLNKLGFEGESLRIERSVMSVMSDDQKSLLKKEIDKLLKSELAKGTVAG
ncbi:hypothetical protein KP001_13660 [Geomonas subterranea]|uniref:Lipoprotein n=1 Tax=Geomonas subterranea TaxID=2847989 RepID=A0ABX8LIV3_9BACT|nr:hypothetical protein [Geomonas subterranea]QXE89490.1 hypothetical protein KP001_13660 [Geomonas subterranea]QXM08395.1 hypothetical protein KP002_15615 [Geomonas subterranea]